MIKEGEELIDSGIEKLLNWKVWVERFLLLFTLGAILFVSGIALTFFVSMAAVGGGWSHEHFLSNPFTQLATLAFDLGVVLCVIGVITWMFASIGYKNCKRSILRPKEQEELIVDSLIARVQNKNYGKYAAVISILGDIGNKRATTSIILALKDEGREVRLKAVDTLGKIGDERAVEPLVAVLEDKVEEVRLKTAKAVDKLGWKPRNDAEKARYLIAKEQWDELTGLGESAIAPLIEALKDGSNGVRKKAAEALGKIGDERAAEPLADALKDRDKSVREVAEQALKNIKKRGQLRYL